MHVHYLKCSCIGVLGYDAGYSSLIDYYALFRFSEHNSYQKVLRSKVARHIGSHLDALADNLGVDSRGFFADHPHNMKDAAAALLINWAEGNTGKTPIWSDLLKAMRESEMTKEANKLEEYLRGGVLGCWIHVFFHCVWSINAPNIMQHIPSYSIVSDTVWELQSIDSEAIRSISVQYQSVFYLTRDNGSPLFHYPAQGFSVVSTSPVIYSTSFLS